MFARARWLGLCCGLLLAAPAALAQDPEACCLPDGNCVVVLVDDCLAMGGIPMGVPTCEGVICEQVAEFRFEFSLDIGSDTELSDPQFNGNEAFDPGDVYWWQGPPVVPPGRDGFKDDMMIFGFDPYPDPPDPNYITRVPVGEGSPDLFDRYFDLDGHDQLDIDLSEGQYIPPEWPLEWPIPEFPSSCIFPARYLMISADDDMAPSWPAFDVPVTFPSPAGLIYGSTAGQDEIIGLTLGGGMIPFPIVNIYPIADEVTVHGSLVPNPDFGDKDDDDVDSLDIVELMNNEPVCPYWYFSPDHEANLGLDPGGIYQAGFGAFVQVIDEAIHLGIPESTDIDAFEFVWAPYEQDPDGPLYLALIYSVDENDPLTGVDESGGLDPAMIYISYLTGWSMPLMEEPFHDDIDALTAWSEPFEPLPPVGACCLPDCACSVMTEADCVAAGGVWAGAGTDCSDFDGNGVADVCQTCAGDINCDGVVDINDLAIFLANYGMPSGATWKNGDFDGDGDVDLSDLAMLLANYGGPCP